MPIFGLVLAIFGLLIIAIPELLSLLVGLVLIFIGGSIIITYLAFKDGKKHSIRFGSYEIFRNKKK